MGPADLIPVLRAHGVSERVIKAMVGLPREQFVPRHARGHAWEDRPLSIGHGQTISQPSLVGLMTDALDLHKGARVLDVGTGSGFQAALLARLGAVVFSIERIAELAQRATATFSELQLPVVVRCGDGTKGWPDHAPYEAIVVAAAGDAIPPALIDQLVKPTRGQRGGRLLMPVRDRPSHVAQTLILVERTETAVIQRELMAVAFVPLVEDRNPGHAQDVTYRSRVTDF